MLDLYTFFSCYFPVQPPLKSVAKLLSNSCEIPLLDPFHHVPDQVTKQNLNYTIFVFTLLIKVVYQYSHFLCEHFIVNKRLLGKSTPQQISLLGLFPPHGPLTMNINIVEGDRVPTYIMDSSANKNKLFVHLFEIIRINHHPGLILLNCHVQN